MSFCSYSSQLITENKTAVDNLFINSFMPFAPNEYVKVYLYGLMLCNDTNPSHNNMEDFCKALHLTQDEIMEAFDYWQQQGIVLILNTLPLQVKFLPVSTSKLKAQKFKEDKYENFNLQVNEILNQRMPSPNEFYEYYVTMESLHIEQEAMLMIIKYCADLKGSNVNYPYILQVAKNWANEGITTTKSVEEKLLEYQKQDEDLALIAKAMGIKRKLDTSERDLYFKWQSMGFLPNLIIFVVKSLKKSKNSVNFKYLDAILEKYYTMKLFSIQEVEAYENQKEELFGLAKNICKNLGVYYENIEPVVENYISNWHNLGYDDETLILISNYCFKSSIRTLELMDKQIQKFYKLGIVNIQSLNQYFESVLEQESTIKELLSSLGLSRNVNNFDRDCYKNWVENWKMSNTLINHAAMLSKDKNQPFVYMNKLLSTWHNNNIQTTEQADKLNLPQECKKAPTNYDTRNYTNQEINSLFTNLEEVEI